MDRKPVFDAVRRMLGRGFHKSEIAALDAAIERAQSFAPAQSSANAPPLPGCTRPRGLGHAGLALIKQFEGCARRRGDGLVEAYPDPGTGHAPWTIGWGSTGPEIGPGTVWTQQQCDERCAEDLKRYAAEVDQALGDAFTSQGQFDAMVSFHYNTGAIRRATLTRKHCAGDHAGARAEFGKWIRAGGSVLSGLVRRRAAEAALYATADQ